MHIKPRKDASKQKEIVARDVRQARTLGPLPDPVCCADCPDHNAAMRCHRHCPSAAARLSSEGERGPVEPLVAPLVFELKRLAVFHPCWSCEGHNDPEGRLWKKPAVWFYSDSVVHLRALANAIDALFNKKRLSERWQLVLTHSDMCNPDATFSLEPVADAPSLALESLQADLRTMAEELAVQFKAACDQLVQHAG